jgi:hypothetical protein
LKQKKRKLPKAINTEELSKKSERRFEDLFCISAGFHPTKVPLESDKGIDYFVNILDQNSQVLPDKFIAQLKSTHKANRKESYVLAKGFPVKTINLMKGDTLPAYVFFYDLETDNMYWGELHNLLDVLHSKGLQWVEKETTTLYFDERHIVNKSNLEKIYSNTQSACSRLSKIVSDEELLDSLLPYCNIMIERTSKGKNIHFSPIKEGFGGRFTFRKEDFEKLQDAQRKGIPCSLAVDSGKLVFTYEKEDIFTLENIEKVQIAPSNKKIPIEILIPNTNVSAGSFTFLLQKRKNIFDLCSEKKYLPWYINISVNPNSRESNIGFKFYREFAGVEEYLRYLTFMKSLSEHKKVTFKSFLGKDINAEFSIGTIPVIQDWETEFFSYLLEIENCTNRKFDIPESVSEEDYENAHLLSDLYSSGEAILPNLSLNFKMLGKHLKEQIPTLSCKGKELIFESKWQVELCGEDFKCDTKSIIDKAMPDNVTENLISCPEKIQDEKEYSFSYSAEKDSMAKIILVKNIEG